MTRFITPSLQLTRTSRVNCFVYDALFLRLFPSADMIVGIIEGLSMLDDKGWYGQLIAARNRSCIWEICKLWSNSICNFHLWEIVIANYIMAIMFFNAEVFIPYVKKYRLFSAVVFFILYFNENTVRAWSSIQPTVHNPVNLWKERSWRESTLPFLSSFLPSYSSHRCILVVCSLHF